jgi:hypothetical protein
MPVHIVRDVDLRFSRGALRAVAAGHEHITVPTNLLYTLAGSDFVEEKTGFLDLRDPDKMLPFWMVLRREAITLHAGGHVRYGVLPAFARSLYDAVRGAIAAPPVGTSKSTLKALTRYLAVLGDYLGLSAVEVLGGIKP